MTTTNRAELELCSALTAYAAEEYANSVETRIAFKNRVKEELAAYDKIFNKWIHLLEPLKEKIGFNILRGKKDAKGKPYADLVIESPNNDTADMWRDDNTNSWQQRREKKCTKWRIFYEHDDAEWHVESQDAKGCAWNRVDAECNSKSVTTAYKLMLVYAYTLKYEKYCGDPEIMAHYESRPHYDYRCISEYTGRITVETNIIVYQQGKLNRGKYYLEWSEIEPLIDATIETLHHNNTTQLGKISDYINSK